LHIYITISETQKRIKKEEKEKKEEDREVRQEKGGRGSYKTGRRRK